MWQAFCDFLLVVIVVGTVAEHSTCMRPTKYKLLACAIWHVTCNFAHTHTATPSEAHTHTQSERGRQIRVSP